MKKTYKYTFLTLSLALAFIFGSMAATNLILYIREGRLLAESGIVAAEFPVRPWQGWENEREKEDGGERYSLTTGQVKDAVESWNQRLGETLHDPVKGQVSMEEAVREGEEWLMAMGMEQGEAMGEGAGLGFVKATLGVGAQKGNSRVPLEPYYSFWTVHFSGSYMDAVLYLNAVTGRLWRAEATFYSNLPEGLPGEKLGRFVEMAGMQAADGAAGINEDKTQAYLAIEDGLLYARLDYQNVVLGDNAVVEHTSRKLPYGRYVVVTYEIFTDPKNLQL